MICCEDFAFWDLHCLAWTHAVADFEEKWLTGDHMVWEAYQAEAHEKHEEEEACDRAEHHGLTTTPLPVPLCRLGQGNIQLRWK